MIDDPGSQSADGFSTPEQDHEIYLTGEFGRQLAKLVRELQHEGSSQEVLDRVAAAAAVLVPGAQEVAISRVRRRREVFTSAATNDRARAFDELQQQVGQGPCLDALYEQQTVRVADLSRETRWPQLVQRVEDLQVRSVLCLRLYVKGDNFGALNLLSSQLGAFDDEAVDIGSVFASHAAVAVADTEVKENMRIALDGRDLIGQAKGILMERYKINAVQAFALLARVSQDTNRKLRDLVAEVATTGEPKR